MTSHEEIWRRYDAIEVRLTAPISERMLDLAALRPGMRVLDLATGRGEPALRAARRVAPAGRVLGVDLSEGLLEMARERAEQEGVSNLELRAMDAARLRDLPPSDFHAATCRWGLMYMDDPVAALEHVRRALVAEGAFVVALWAEPERVAYYGLPRLFLPGERSTPEVEPEAPGPFRFSTLELIERDFGRAGFRLDHVEEIDIPVFEAETAAEVVAWAKALGMAKLLNPLPATAQAAWASAFSAALEDKRVGGMIQLGGVTRLVRARSV
jgi:SAM-dependent methyltransferase